MILAVGSSYVRRPKVEDELSGAYDELLHGHKAQPMQDLAGMLCGFHNKLMRVILDSDDEYEGKLIEVGEDGFMLYHEHLSRTLIIMYKFVKAIEIWQTTKPKKEA